MKLRVITKNDGTIVGSQRVSAFEHLQRVQGGLMAGPGQKLHEIDIPDEIGSVEDGAVLHKRLHAYLAKG